MRRAIVRSVSAVLSLFAGGAKAIDLSTPEKAVASFYGAYARQNVDEVVAARDFEFEAREQLGSAADDEVVRQTARRLEADFREEIRSRGFPKGSPSNCHAISHRMLRHDLVQVFWECPGPGNGSVFVPIYAARNETGWRVALLRRPPR
ncbi:hypothetical protein [Reyranella sp. CPCC 100927]|uniref:hypothetical protein n=1 Tax=Reyranella sp. CPCC 100927 TaxID=2599616 RepID=UPI0011B6D7B0|nr:hypothetical protein [Reyranella sp. CPCC 100927]TWT09479.1 hypothetical protein FQU96_20085 [Reyranella sp. CPCC 100927]